MTTSVQDLLYCPIPEHNLCNIIAEYKTVSVDAYLIAYGSVFGTQVLFICWSKIELQHHFRHQCQCLKESRVRFPTGFANRRDISFVRVYCIKHQRIVNIFNDDDDVNRNFVIFLNCGTDVHDCNVKCIHAYNKFDMCGVCPKCISIRKHTEMNWKSNFERQVKLLPDIKIRRRPRIPLEIESEKKKFVIVNFFVCNNPNVVKKACEDKHSDLLELMISKNVCRGCSACKLVVHNGMHNLVTGNL